MAMVKSIASTLKCVYHIQDYLEKNNRAPATSPVRKRARRRHRSNARATSGMRRARTRPHRPAAAEEDATTVEEAADLVSIGVRR